MTAFDNAAMQALSDAGAQCGDCGDQPGDRICPDCERCYGWYVAALRKAGWAPRTEVLNEAARELTNLPLWYTADLHADWETGVQEAAKRVQEMADDPAAAEETPAADEQPAAVEFGVRTPSGVLTPTTVRAEAEQRLARSQYPDAVLVQRTVHYGPWIEVAR